MREVGCVGRVCVLPGVAGYAREKVAGWPGLGICDYLVPGIVANVICTHSVDPP